MRLENCEIRPGTVVEVCDSYGVIKAACTGYFSEEDDPALLPPVYPFFQASSTSFNQPQINDLIWVVVNNENPQELFYMFRSNIKNTTNGILEKSPKDSNILCCRDSGFSKAILAYDSSDGWNMQNDSSNINIDKEGNISFNNNRYGHSIVIDSDGIHIMGNSQQAVLGNNLLKSLRKLCACLQDTAVLMQSNPYTSAVGLELESRLSGFETDIESILSNKVTLS